MRMSLLVPLVFSVALVAQSTPPAASDNLARLQNQVRIQQVGLDHLQRETRSIRSQQKAQAERIDLETRKMEGLAGETRDRSEATASRVGMLETMSLRHFAWFGAALMIFAVATCGMFLLLRRRNKDLFMQIRDTHRQLEVEALKLDAKLITLMERQWEAYRKVEPRAAERDHSLALRLGEEVYRMRHRLSGMDTATKEVKALLRSIDRLEEDFNHQGYELLDLLNKPFTEGLVARTQFLHSDTLGSGERIITRVIKPPVLFQGVALQPPEIEVSVGG